MDDQEQREVMARVIAMPGAEQEAAVGAGFAALREALESDDRASIKFTFEALSAVLDGVAESRLREIAALCSQSDPSRPSAVSPDQVADALARALAEMDQQLGAAMLTETIEGKEIPGRSPEEDFLYRAWAVTAASCEEIRRLLRENPTVHGTDEHSLEVFLLVVKSYTEMAAKLPPGGLLPKFRLEKTQPGSAPATGMPLSSPCENES